MHAKGVVTVNFKHLENVYSKATSVFFYDVFDMLLNSDDSDNLFVVFVARRCFVLSRLYLNEYIINKKLDQVSIQKIKSHIFTDSAFRMLSLTLSEKCYKTDYVFSVLLCDDILIHGRSIGELLSSAESLFIKKYYELSEIKKIDYELNEQISKKFLHNIKIKTIFRNESDFLLHSRFLSCLDRVNPENILPPSKWREISYAYSRLIAESDIPNVTFVASILKIDDSLSDFAPKLLSNQGYCHVNNDYLGRKLDNYIKVLNVNDDVKALYTVRITDKYIVPFIFLPEISNYKFIETQKSIFFYLITETESEELKKEYAEMENWFLGFDRYEESSVCSIQFINFFLSLNLFRNYLDNLDLNDDEKSILYNSLDFDLIGFNYFHKESVISLAKRILDTTQKPVLGINQLDEIIVKALDKNFIIGDNCNQIYVDVNSESIDYSYLENIAFKYAIESETKAHRLEQGSLEPSDFSIKEILYPERKSLERFFVNYYDYCNNKKKEAICLEQITASILQLMDAGILAASASRNGEKCMFYLRSSEQALTTVPYRYSKFIPFLFEIEKHNPSQSPNFQDYYLRELKYFLNEDYTKSVDRNFQPFLAEIRGNQKELVELIKQMFSSSQSFGDYLFIVLYKNNQERLDEMINDAKGLYRAVMF